MIVMLNIDECSLTINGSIFAAALALYAGARGKRYSIKGH
jgi:hypothetical protein